MSVPTFPLPTTRRTSPEVVRPDVARGARAARPRAHVAGLAAVLFLAAFLNGFRLDQMGLGSLYYAAAVWSMLSGWHAFFFVALDPAGFLAAVRPFLERHRL